MRTLELTQFQEAVLSITIHWVLKHIKNTHSIDLGTSALAMDADSIYELQRIYEKL